MSEKSRKNPRKIKKALDKTAYSGYTNGAVSDEPQQISGCSAVLVARLNGVQEAVSSILATRTKQNNPNLFPIGDGFGLFVFFGKLNMGVRGR
jgi:hypothetical protein